MSAVSRQTAFLLSGFLVLAIFSNFPFFLDAATGSVRAPLFLAALIAGAAVLGVLNPHRIAPFVKTDVFKLLCFMIFLYGCNWAWLQFGNTGASPDEIDNTERRIRQFLTFPAAAFIIFIAGPQQLHKWLLLGVFTVPVPIIVQFFAPDLLDIFDTLRASGFFLNPNQACEGALLWLAMVQQRLRGPLLLLLYALVALAVVLTFSRSGLVGCLLLGGYLLYKGRVPRVSLVIPVLIVVFYSALLVNAEAILSNFVADENQRTFLMERFDFVGSLGEEGSGEDDSAVERKLIVGKAFGMALESPIVGYGRETHFMLGLASHNIVIDLWFTFGVLGLALYLTIGWLLYRAGVRQGLGLINPYLILYLWFSPFNHAHTTAIYWMVFYSFVMLSGGRQEKSSRKTSKRRKSNKSIDFSDYVPAKWHTRRRRVSR